MYSTTPNVSDYCSFLQNVVGTPSNVLTYALAPPAVPALSSVVGGSLPATTYFVVLTYTNTNGETTVSTEASLAVAAGSLLQVAAPAALSGATGWNVYVGTRSGGETLQDVLMAFGTPWTEPATGLIPGVSPPLVNSTPSSIITTTLNIAVDIVNLALQQASPDIYVLAVYNLAADRLINYAQDTQPSVYFTTIRSNLKLSAITSGVTTSTSDNGTSMSLLNPEQMREFTLQDLQTMRTPYGRQYMAFAQMYGPTLWGLT